VQVKKKQKMLFNSFSRVTKKKKKISFSEKYFFIKQVIFPKNEKKKGFPLKQMEH
jgi:ABC-type amino acid transport substrate-binding protein